MTKQFTYDQTKKTNRIKDKKIEIIERITDFFAKFCNAIFSGCFDAIIRCDILPKKTWDAMRFSMRLPPWLRRSRLALFRGYERTP